MLQKIFISLLACTGLVLGPLTSPASATKGLPTASAVATGSRVQVAFKGKAPTKATLIVAGSRYPLKRLGKVWRTKPLSAQVLAVMAGARAKLNVRIGGKTKTLRTTVRGTNTTPPSPSPGPAPGPDPAPGPGPAPAPVPAALFSAPGTDSTGNAAWEAIKGYFANSTVTDCPAGWPNCAVEIRYGFFENGTQWYCRLTPTSGSDIRSVGTITSIVGAEQKADGAWGVSYTLDSYGSSTYYSVRVAANGAANVQYWAPGADPSGPPTSVDAGLQWLRGAKDCSY